MRDPRRQEADVRSRGHAERTNSIGTTYRSLSFLTEAAEVGAEEYLRLQVLGTKPVEYSGNFEEKRRWVRRDVDFLVRLIFPTHGLREVQSANFRMLDLSEGGAALYVGSFAGSPDYFYLQFGDEKSELLSCYLVQRTQRTLSCRFSNPLPTAQIDAIIAQKELDLTIESLFSRTKEDLVDDFLGSFVK